MREGGKSLPIENKEKRTHVHDFLDLNPKETEVLKDKIIKSQGAVRIVIHPYYAKQNHPTRPYKQIRNDPNQRVGLVEDSFKKMISIVQNVPVILFEGKSGVRGTKAIITPILQAANNEIYLVKTRDDFSTPLIGENGENWKAFSNLMTSLGIKKIVIGGMNLGVAQSFVVDNSGDEYLVFCVGAAIRELKSNFDIQVSNLSHPQSRGDLKKKDFFRGKESKI